MSNTQCINYGFTGNKIEARVARLRALVSKARLVVGGKVDNVNPILDDLDYALGTVDTLVTMRIGVRQTLGQRVLNLFQDLRLMYLLDKQTRTMNKAIELAAQEI